MDIAYICVISNAGAWGEHMNRSICFFAGHSDVRETIYPALLEAVGWHITEYGEAESRVGNSVALTVWPPGQCGRPRGCIRT